MIVIMGRHAKVIHSQLLPSYRCPHCGKQGTVELGVLERWVSLSYAPFFPLRRQPLVVCTDCGNEVRTKDVPPTDRQLFDDAFKRASEPLPKNLKLWSMSIVFAVATVGLILFGTVRSAQTAESQRQIAAILQAPEQGDLYKTFIVNPSGVNEFTVAKVTSVGTDQLEVVLHRARKPSHEAGDTDIADFTLSADQFDATPITVQRGKLGDLILMAPGQMNALGMIYEVSRGDHAYKRGG